MSFELRPHPLSPKQKAILRAMVAGSKIIGYAVGHGNISFFLEGGGKRKELRPMTIKALFDHQLVTRLRDHPQLILTQRARDAVAYYDRKAERKNRG